MSNFAVTSSNQVIDSVNYLLSNFNTGNTIGNIVVPDGTLVANPTTGEITQFNVSGSIYGYVNQYINLRYATNSSGTTGFSSSPTNATYFGVYNSSSPTPSSNPAAYQWREVAGGFGTTKTIYYSSIGGRQVLWAAASSPPSSSYVISVDNVAIDLDIVTTATGTAGGRGPIAMAYVVTTADPNTATSSQLTAWFEAARDAVSPPIGTGLTPVAGDTATFIYGAGAGTPSGTFSYNGSVWNLVVGQVISGNVIVANSTPGTAIVDSSISGSKIGTNTIGNVNIQIDAITADRIAANTITGNKIQANTITGNLITVGTLTGNLIAANTITGNLIQANTITGNLIQANAITATNIAANTITATEISSSYIYAGNIVSQTATLGNTASPGYWLRYTDGAARFGGNVSIGANAAIGGNLSVTGLITSGGLNANTVNTVQVVPNAISFTSGAEVFNQDFTTTAIAGTNYFISGPTTVTAQSNQPVSVWSFASWELTMRPTGSATANGQLVGRIVRWPTGSPGVSSTLLTYTKAFTQTMPGSGVDYVIRLNDAEFPPLLDIVPSSGNYTYGWVCSVTFSFSSGTYTRKLSLSNNRASGLNAANTILISELKR